MELIINADNGSDNDTENVITDTRQTTQAVMMMEVKCVYLTRLQVKTRFLGQFTWK